MISSRMDPEVNSRFKGLIFDMDGTLTVPIIDFQLIRRELGIEHDDRDLADIIGGMPLKGRADAWALIETHEKIASARNRLQPHANEVLRRFADRGIKLAIITRNSHDSVRKLLEKIEVGFDVVLTREFPHIKPDPQTVRHVLRHWGFDASECLMIGDYIHDIQAGKRAGAYSCFFRNDGAKSWEEEADFTVRSFLELEKLVIS